MSNDYDPLDLEARDAEQSAAKTDVKNALLQEVEDFLYVMRSKQGRRFIWRLLTWTHVFQTSFTGNSETFFREGERNIGVKLINEIHSHCYELYGTMVKEQRNDK